MTDLANLVLAVDATQVKTSTAALDGLTAAGQRAESATIGLGGGMKGAGIQAAAMAAGAQASARAAMDQAAGFGVATSAARVNTLAMRESLVVARELARGNFTRIPGSLTLLAQGIGSQGGLSAFAQAIGLIKKVQDAELAEAAVAASTAAAGVRAAAERAGANILAADTEIALAEAQLRVAEGSAAEAAAQVRLAAAQEAVAAAAAEAAIAENALAVAEGRAGEASGAAAAAARTSLGTTGAVLVSVAAAATTLVLGFEAIKQSVSDSGVLRDYAENLGLTSKKFDELKEKTDDFALTWGDVWHGVKKAAEDALDQSNAWQNFKQGNESAFKSALDHAVNFAAFMQGHVSAAYQTIVDQWKNFPAAFGDVFVQAVNLAIGAINDLVKHGAEVLNTFIATVNKIPGIHIGNVGAPEIGLMNNPNAGAAAHLGNASQQYAATAAKNTAAAKAQIEKNLGIIYGDVIDAADERIKKAGGNPPKPKKPKKESDHGLQEALDKLNAEIRGQLALADAYGVSDAAVLKAEALQKAEEDAIKHKSSTGVFYELELQKAVATRAAEGAKHLSDITFETNARAKLNDAVAAGTMTTKEANDQLKLDTELRPLAAAYAVAEGAAKTKLGQIIAALTGEQKKNNDETARGQALAQIASNDNEIAKLKLEASLMGASNRERAVAIAQLEAVQQLDQMGVNDPTTRASYVNSAVNKAVAGVQSPFQQWAQDIPQTADAINQALQSIEFKGIDSLASSITDVITGTKNLGQAFSDISKQIIGDILQMIIKMLIFKALSSVFGGVFGGGGGNPSVGLGAIGANGLVLSGGNVIPFANGGVFNSPTLFPMSGGRTGLMAEAGPEAVMPLSRDNRGRLGVKAQGGSNDNAHVVEVRIATDQNFHAEVQQIAGRTIISAAPTIAKSAVDATVKMMSRRPITGGRG